MADRVEALVLQMSADISRLEKGLAKARQKANAELGEVEKRFDKTSKKIQKDSDGIGTQLTNATRNIPIIGDALAGLGPAGLAAGTGILAAGFALKAMYDSATKARESIDAIAASAKTIGTSAETFQALKISAAQLDVPLQVVEKGMAKLQLGAAQAAFAQGDLYSSLQKTNPELLEQIVASETQEDRWDALSRAITAQTSQTDKLSIAKAAFGKQAGQLVRLLDGEENTIANLTNKYRELGLILSEDLVAAVAAADDRITLANARMEVNGTRAAAAMIPVVEGLTTAWSNLNIAVGEWFDRWNDIDNRQIGTLASDLKDQERVVTERMDAWRKAAADVDAYPTPTGTTSANVLKRLKNEAALQAQLFYDEQAKYFAIRTALDTKKAVINEGPTSDGSFEDEDALEAAAREAERRASELEQQRLRAAQVLGELGDITELVAIKEREMNELVAAGLLTRDEATAAVEKYRATFDKVTEAEKAAIEQQKEWQSIIERGRNPVEQAEAALSAFWAAIAEGVSGPPEQAAAVLQVLEQNLVDAATAAREATPEFKAVAAARLAMAEAAMGAMDASERAAAERARLNGLVGVDGFTQAEADQGVADFILKETAGLRDATRDSVKEGLRQGLATDDWGGAIRNIIADSVVTGLDKALNQLADLLTEFLLGTPGGGASGASGIFDAIGQIAGFRANGGPVAGGRDYVVGEKGPEILRLGAGQSGQVFNAAQVNAMNAGAAGGAMFVDASIRIGGVDMVTWPQMQAALARQQAAIAARIPGGVNATLADNRRQKRRY